MLTGWRGQPAATNSFSAQEGIVTRVAAALILSASAAAGLHRVAPPAVVPASAPSTTFSSERAMAHVRAIARAPHPAGSAEHARVRDYVVEQLRALRLAPSVQEATAVEGSTAGHVENIVARLRGRSGPAGAILLAAHYDGVAAGPAAGDDAAGVAALLETARALRAGTPLEHDVILLVSDGEEDGLLGAAAFVAEHPWRGNVGTVLNVDARGASGASIMFETSDGNADLIGLFARSNPHPVAASLAYAVYRLLPNDTDFSVFRRAGWKGYNFALIGSADRYHTRADTPALLDERSLQHHGAQLVALVRALASSPAGTSDVGRTRVAGNATFFVLPGVALVRYPSSLVVPLVVLAAALLVVAIALRRGALTGRALAASVVLSLVAVLAASIIGAACWRLIELWHTRVGGDPSPRGVYAVGVTLLAAAIALWIAWFATAFMGDAGRLAGAAVWWLVLAVAIAAAIPDGAYLATWPALLAALSLLVTTRARSRWASWFASLAAASVLVALVTPHLHLLAQALLLSPTSAAVVGALSALTALVAAHPILVGAGRDWRVPGLLTVAAGGALIRGMTTVRDTPEHPRVDSMAYALDADRNSAYWVALGPHEDRWTARFLGSSPARRPLPALFGGASAPLAQSAAPLLPLAPAGVSVLADSGAGVERVLDLRLSVPPEARSAIVGVLSGRVSRLAIDGHLAGDSRNGKDPAADARHRFIYTAVPASGVHLRYTLDDTQPLVLEVTAVRHGLPSADDVPTAARPPETTARGWGDVSLVTRTVRF